MINIGIIGANGYTGYELLRLLSFHKKAKVVFASSRSMQGTKVCDLYPSLLGAYGTLEFCGVNEEDFKKYKADVIFTALPHGASAKTAAELIEKGYKVIDLSADFRYNSMDLYEKIYGIDHPAKQFNDEAIYGLTELYRDKIKTARLIANPGCYTTTSILALYPLVNNNLIDIDSIFIDAKSGITGAGRKEDIAYNYCESADSLKAYAVTKHRHTSEIEEQLSTAAKKTVNLSFTPHLLPTKRGIFASIYASCNASEEQINKAYDSFYKSSNFVKVEKHGIMPQLKWVVGSNMCRIGYTLDKRLNRIVINSVTDNLIKGASGQAIQNMNVMFGLDETEGLPLCGFDI